MAFHLKVFVVQHGARHRYAVPRILCSSGTLTGFFTDSHATSPLGKLAGVTQRFFPRFASMGRLSERKIVGVLPNLVDETDRWFFKQRLLRKLAAEDTAAWLKARDESWFALTHSALASGTNVLYSMGGENLRLLQQARNREIKIVTEAFITPLNLRQTRDSKIAHGIPLSKDEEGCQHVEDHYNRVFACSDIILCPSKWVAEGVTELSPEQAHKIRICPYGSSLPASEVPRAPVPGRIFWAGGDWFRKGLHHLAAAADLALRESPGMQFRVAGITDPKTISMDRFRNLHFLGKLDRVGMQEEFSKADLFVFPTLTEGMASVLVESFTAGCPVLTTCGAGFDGLEESGAGRLFEAGDAPALASLMLQLTRDRQDIQAMNDATTRFAPNFTEDAWGKRLIRILEELTG